ncbi:hypothetical protein Sjap_002686 [Stephania japonica]|uniref:Uncharacterized protein n=1 Tax=Stephania japonica TaxID=461633 RepID=A0AAP0KMJ1_9MAGN
MAHASGLVSPSFPSLTRRNLSLLGVSRSGFSDHFGFRVNQRVLCCCLSVEGEKKHVSDPSPSPMPMPMPRLVTQGCKLIGCGSAVPDLLISMMILPILSKPLMNGYLCVPVSETAEFFQHQFYFICIGILWEWKDSLTGLAAVAARNALQMAEVDPDDVDLVLMCTSTPEDLFGSAPQLNTSTISSRSDNVRVARSACACEGSMFDCISSLPPPSSPPLACFILDLMVFHCRDVSSSRLSFYDFVVAFELGKLCLFGRYAYRADLIGRTPLPSKPLDPTMLIEGSISCMQWFVLGLVSAACHIRGGGFKNVLVIGADSLSRHVDWTDRGTCILFGDAAGAVVVQACDGNEDGLFSFDLHSDGDGQRHLNASIKENEPHDELGSNGSVVDFPPSRPAYSFIEMNGKEANQRIIDSVATRLDVPPERVISNLVNYGNTSAASIPLALDEAVRSGKVQSGHIIAAAGFGAGLTWGSAIMRWG